MVFIIFSVVAVLIYGISNPMLAIYLQPYMEYLLYTNTDLFLEGWIRQTNQAKRKAFNQG